MLTEFVLANVAVGGLSILTAPLLFRALLELRYPPGFREEASGALAEGFAPGPHRSVPEHARVIPLSHSGPGPQRSDEPPNSGWSLKRGPSEPSEA